MARSRLIRPEFWNDEKLATLSRDSRLTFIGIWTASDDYGVAKGHLTWLKNQIYPYENISMATFEKWIKELESLRVIIPFVYHDENYYFIKNFSKHQKVDHPSKMRNPEPPHEILATGSREFRVETDTETETETETNGMIEEKVEYAHRLQEYIATSPEFVNIRKLQNQITEKECERIEKKFDQAEIKKVLRSMENYKPLTKKYKSVGLTLENWLEREYGSAKKSF